ncbi:MAG: hypothetical protein WAN68_20375, partial [Pseudolabrys sp.]
LTSSSEARSGIDRQYGSLAIAPMARRATVDKIAQPMGNLAFAGGAGAGTPTIRLGDSLYGCAALRPTLGSMKWQRERPA